MEISIPLAAALIALTSMGCQKERDDKTAPITPKEVPVPAKVAEVSIISASVVEDCPDPKKSAAASQINPREESKAASQEAKEPRREDEGAGLREMEADSDSAFAYVEPCLQSTVQFSITDQGDRSSKFIIKEMRLLDSEGKSLGIAKVRTPTLWKEQGYVTWDQMLLPKTDVKASYKVSPPGWEGKGWRHGYGAMFYLEADVEVDGVTKTVRSSGIVREPPEMVET